MGQSDNHPTRPSDDKTLIFVSIFMNQDYVKLLSLLLTSLFINRGRNDFKFLVITDAPIRDVVVSTTPIALFDYDFFLMDCESVFQSAYNRLRIFDYPDIEKYSNILYLDLDILISNNMDHVLQKKEALIPTKLSAMKEGTIMKKFWGGSFFFTLEELKEFDCLDGFCSGVLFFRNNEEIQSLFEHVLEDIETWKTETDYIPSLLEQPFLNHRTARRGQRELEILEGLIEMNPSTQQNQTLSHFAGGPGKSYSKIAKMSRFMQSQLLPSAITHFSNLDQLEVTLDCLVSRRYDWLHNLTDSNGSIYFREKGVLETSWSKGNYKFLSQTLVLTKWSGIVHLLMLSDDYTKMYSIRPSNLQLSKAIVMAE